jgi:hypothetical protein
VLAAGNAVYTIDGAITAGHTDYSNVNQVLDFSLPDLTPLPPEPTTTALPPFVTTTTAHTTPSTTRRPSTSTTPSTRLYRPVVRSTVPNRVRTTTTTTKALT